MIIFGNIKVGTEIASGSVNYIWEAAVPHAESVPLFNIPIERFSAFCYGVAILTPAATCGFYFYRYCRFNKHKDLFFSIAQFLLLANIILQVTVTMTAFLSDISFYLFDIINQLTNVYSLFTVYISLYILFTIYGQYHQSVVEKAVYATLTLLHIFTMYWFLLADIYGLFASQDQVYFKLVKLQSKTVFVWKTIYIVVEMSPSIVILFKVFTNFSQKKVYSQKTSIYLMGLLLVMQICTVLAFEILNIVVNYTIILGSDRANSAMNGIFYCLQALNSLFVVVIYSMLVKMMVEIRDKKPQRPPSKTIKNKK
ncbi:hypothetical protein HDV01_003365 [Terramyces sp. JEL0728]|nr:hypothetical protein HDV01_003365 [Terramyces sp. JEL0728]